MNKSSLAALLLLPALGACSAAPGEPAAPGPEAPAAPGAPAAAGPVAESAPNPLDMAVEADTRELLEALARGGDPAFVVLRPGTTIAGYAVRDEDHAVARATRWDAGTRRLTVELPVAGVDAQGDVALDQVRYLKTLDLARVGAEVESAMGKAVGELDDFDLDEAARRAAANQPFAGALPQKDFDCIARFARITESRDFAPFPLGNCAAPQDPVGDPERIADAQQARKVADNIFARMVADYANAQAMIASLQARLAAIQNAYVFIRHHPYFKEYNVLHFKDFLHGRKSYNDRFKRAEALLIQAALVTQAQIAAYAAVPPPDAKLARSDANRIVARKWNCVMHPGLLNAGGRSGSTVVGVSLETLGAPFVDVQVMLDDHPPMPQAERWGGIFDVTPTSNLTSDVTRVPVANLVPVRASVGLPIVMFRFQPLDAKKTRPVGQACNLRAGIVL